MRDWKAIFRGQITCMLYITQKLHTVSIRLLISFQGAMPLSFNELRVEHLYYAQTHGEKHLSQITTTVYSDLRRVEYNNALFATNINLDFMLTRNFLNYGVLVRCSSYLVNHPKKKKAICLKNQDRKGLDFRGVDVELQILMDA